MTDDLIEAAKNLLEQCYQADALEELPANITGELMDAVRDGLIAASPAPTDPVKLSDAEREMLPQADCRIHGCHKEPNDALHAIGCGYAIRSVVERLLTARLAAHDKPLVEALAELLKGCEHEGEHHPDGTETNDEDGYSIACGACERAGQERKAKAIAALARYGPRTPEKCPNCDSTKREVRNPVGDDYGHEVPCMNDAWHAAPHAEGEAK